MIPVTKAVWVAGLPPNCGLSRISYPLSSLVMVSETFLIFSSLTIAVSLVVLLSASRGTGKLWRTTTTNRTCPSHIRFQTGPQHALTPCWKRRQWHCARLSIITRLLFYRQTRIRTYTQTDKPGKIPQSIVTVGNADRVKWPIALPRVRLHNPSAPPRRPSVDGKVPGIMTNRGL